AAKAVLVPGDAAGRPGVGRVADGTSARGGGVRGPGAGPVRGSEPQARGRPRARVPGRAQLLHDPGPDPGAVARGVGPSRPAGAGGVLRGAPAAVGWLRTGRADGTEESGRAYDGTLRFPIVAVTLRARAFTVAVTRSGTATVGRGIAARSASSRTRRQQTRARSPRCKRR